MIDSEQVAGTAEFHPFEGMRLTTKSPGDMACAKFINGKLLIPYSRDGIGKPIGHYYDCKVIEGTLHCRFEHFDSAHAGVLFLSVGPNHTPRGGPWTNQHLTEADRQDCSRWTKSLPRMKPVVWVRILKQAIPVWAEKYFQEGWPKKIDFENALQAQQFTLGFL